MGLLKNWLRKMTKAEDKIEGSLTAGDMSQWLENTNANPRRVDNRKGGWGHICHLKNRFEIEVGVDTGLYWKVDGHMSPSLRVGDEIIFGFNEGDGVCVVVSIKNMSDPPDMFSGTVRWLGYLDDLEKRKITTEHSPQSQIAIMRAKGATTAEIEAATGLTAPGNDHNKENKK